VAAKLAEVCPVDIYATAEDGSLRIVEENLDECVLCRLCIEASPPGAVAVRKRYDGNATL
jgi:NAD-dependent dihydropyrimidine dehydrogenase PreA subunit